jgi:spermidine synthase
VSHHLDRRADGSLLLYIDGDLQFDSRDEAIYHESLALPALTLASRENAENLNVLICGGGDGLALRECLRFPGVSSVDLVENDPEVVSRGRSELAVLNQCAFENSRTRIYIEDAWDFLSTERTYDAILCDFTVPRRSEDSRVFTLEWYERVRAALKPAGVAALNAVSPQLTPEAFWCLRKTIREAKLSALPYRVCIPSFREHGYGAWGFILASRSVLGQKDLSSLACPIETRQADLARLWRGARFSRRERLLERSVPVHTLKNACLVPLLLNPDNPGVLKSKAALDIGTEPYDLGPLMGAIPIVHPYHTRHMIETLADQVVGAIQSLDIRRLIESLLRRAKELPGDLVRELRKLRSFLRSNTPSLDSFRTWSYRLFAALVITMTLANAICPDNAFAKGSGGLGHASMSRGYSGGFGGGRGSGHTFASGSTHAGSSGFFGGGARVSGSGFRGSYGRGGMTDIYGYSYRPRYYFFCGGGYYHTHPRYVYQNRTASPAPPPEKHQALFVADDDMMVLDSGDVVIILSDTAYLLVTGGTLALMSTKVSDPLVPLYPDPKLFDAIDSEIRDQQAISRQEEAARRDWIGWVGWTSALFPAVADDKRELHNLQDLNKKLDAAIQRKGRPPSGASPVAAATDQVELFVGGYLLPDNTVALRLPDNGWIYTNGKQFWTSANPTIKQPSHPELAAVIRSVMTKLQKELAADVASDESDLRTLQTDRSNLQADLLSYQAIYQNNGYNGYYEVDYGTDEIPVSQAISRTEQDLSQNQLDYGETMVDRTKSARDLDRLRAALDWFGK